MTKTRTVKGGRRAAARRGAPALDQTIRVRLSTYWHAELRRMAERAGLTDSQFVRAMLETHRRIEGELLRRQEVASAGHAAALAAVLAGSEHASIVRDLTPAELAALERAKEAA